jgi:nitrogen-specific signal transduction histidine kinase/CheY-like chemotaxis protein
MYLISYLAQNDAHITAVQERLGLAQPPMVMVVARTVPELINQAQTLPLRAILADIALPRATWQQLTTTLRQTHPSLPVLALTATDTEDEWWHYAHDLAQLDDRPDLFLFRLQRQAERAASASMEAPAPVALPTLTAPPVPSMLSESPSLLENPQFRNFAEIFTGMQESALTESFVAWVQQACQTSRAVLLLQDPLTGAYQCAAHRGLPSSLAPYCQFAQTAPLCRWLAGTGRILLKDNGAQPGDDVLSGLDLMQAVAAVPILFDGQLVGILGIGPRLIGQSYSAFELEGLFALGGQIAVAIQHSRLHHSLRGQQEMTEHMLTVMPSGTIVLGENERIAFVNTAAAAMIGGNRASLDGQDLRALPSPLGDLAFAAIRSRQDHPRQEVEVGPEKRPLAVTALALPTTPPSALLLLEDLSDRRQLGEERERRVNLEVITNLVHYLAHELRNPLVALSTFSSLVPERATDPDFQEFCATVLQGEIGRVNLLLEQLLVLTDHADFHFGTVNLLPILDRLTNSEELRQRVVASVPLILPPFAGDGQRLETALTCILRSVTKQARPETPATLRVEIDGDRLVLHTEVPAMPDLVPEWFLNPWEQFLGQDEQYVDLGLATAQYIVEQHNGTLSISFTDSILTVICRLPLHTDAHTEESDHVEPRSRRGR